MIERICLYNDFVERELEENWQAFFTSFESATMSQKSSISAIPKDQGEMAAKGWKCIYRKHANTYSLLRYLNV